ncbi:MAG: nuclear transport factor 2 family protein [Gammaproteobacteria bacterium]
MTELEQLAAQVRELADRQAIRDVVVRYSRGVDRLDRQMLLSAYHPDAIDDHGMFVGSPEEFADYFFDYHGRFQHTTQHIVTNQYCELDGDVAHTETYWLFAAMNTQGAPLSLAGGRYVDRMERRAGRWAIAQRKCIIDWHGQPGDSGLDHAAMQALQSAGLVRRDRGDPSYERPLAIDPKRIAAKIRL